MKKLNCYVALTGLLLGLLVLIIIPFQITSAASVAIGMDAKAFPKFAAWGIIICSLGLLINTLVSTDDEAAPKFIWSRELKVLLILVLILAYALLNRYLGFFISTVLMGSAYLLMNKDRVWYHHVIYFVFIFACYYLFTNVLYIHLPKIGIWFF